MKPLHRLPCERLRNPAALGESYALGLVRDGLRLQWAQNPPPCLYSQPSEVCSESTTLVASILLSDAIREDPHDYLYAVSGLILVPKKGLVGEQWRPALNLKRVNAYLSTNYFQPPTLWEIALLIRPQYWGIYIDLPSAYYHLAIHPADQAYMGMEYDGHHYLWQGGMPFGLATAPRE